MMKASIVLGKSSLPRSESLVILRVAAADGDRNARSRAFLEPQDLVGEDLHGFANSDGGTGISVAGVTETPLRKGDRVPAK
jgi:hypothetical protein